MSKGYRDAFPIDSKNSAHPTGRPGFWESPPEGFTGTDFSQLSREERIAMFQKILELGLHGIAYSPYLDGQSPGTEISPEQIRERLAIISRYTRWIRTFSCNEGNEHIPAIAHEMGLKTLVGIGIGDELEKNEVEIEGGIALARAGHADILAVGNEVLLRGDLNEGELLDLISRVRAEVPGVPIGYVDAYFLFEKHPALVEACDVILINCYPYWEYCAVEYSLPYMQEMYRRIKRVAGDKPVIISETGWPTQGTPYGAAVPGYDNALNYFLNTMQWAEEEGVEIFYFSSFDEAWKVGDEGDVGAYWGLWDKDGHLKFQQGSAQA
jgi:exo-beta-1,3-glucanase (GH17 family)